MALDKISAPPALRVAMLATLGVIGFWAYLPTLADVVGAWQSNPDYSHGFLVVPLSALLLWWTRSSAPSTDQWRFAPAALLLVGFACALRIFTGRVYLPELDAWSFPLWIASITWLVFGWRTLVWAAPALLFLSFAAPLPASIEHIMGGPLREVGATLSSMTLRALGEPAVAEGATILLNEHQLDVEQACSGLRMFYGVTALAVCLAILLRPPVWQAVLLVLSALPVAIVANVIRIVATGLLHDRLSSETARQLGHDYAGLLVIPIGFVVLLLIFRAMQRITTAVSGERPVSLPLLATGGAAVAVVAFAAVGFVNTMEGVAVNKILQSADACVEREEWPQAIDYLTRGLQLRPDDHSMLVQIAKVQLKQDDSQVGLARAFRWYERAHRIAPHDAEVGLATARAAYAAGRYEKAAALTAKLISKASEGEGRDELVRLRADAALRAARERRDWPSLDEDCRAALRASAELDDPTLRHVEALVADMDRRAAPSSADPLAGEADRLMDRLAEVKPNESGTWLARYAHNTRRAERLTEAEPKRERQELAAEDLRRAITEAEKHPGPDAAEAYLVAAQTELREEQTAAAEASLRRAIEAWPEDHRAYLMLAKLLAGDEATEGLEAAAEVLEEGVAARSGVEITLTVRLATYRAKLGQLDAAQAQIELLRGLLKKIPENLRAEVRLATDLVEAEIVTRRDGPSVAAAGLRDAITRAQSDRSGVPSHALLGQSIELLGQLQAASGWHEMAAQTLLSAATLAPLDEPALRVLASSAAHFGDLQLAQSTYDQLLARRPDDAALRAEALGVAIRQRTAVATEDTPWADLELKLREAAEAGLEGPAVLLMQAEVLTAHGDAAAAAAMLGDAAEASPESDRLWRGLAIARQKAGDDEGALEAAKRFASARPDHREADLFLCRLLIRLGRLSEAANEAKRLIGGGQSKGGEAWLLLAEVELQRGDAAAAVAALQSASVEAPEQVRPVQAMAQLASIQEDWPRVAELEERLRQLEGEAGVYWRLYAAHRYLAAADNITDPILREAASVAQQLRRLRPEWTESYYLEGEVERRIGNPAAATRAYLAAWRRGKRDPAVADRLLETLVRQQRFDEATDFLSQIRGLLATSPRLFDRVTTLSLEGQSMTQLVDLARAFVERDPKSPAARARLARVLTMAASTTERDTEGEALAQRYRDEAQSHLEESVRLAPGSAATWVTALLLGTGDEPTLESVTRRFDELTEIAPLDGLSRHYVLAQSLEAIGLRREASDQYSECLGLLRREERPSPNAAEITARASRFFRPVSVFLAERLAREAAHHDPDSTPARLALAEAIASGGSNPDEGLELLASLESLGVADPDNLRRLQAELLMRRGDPADLSRAIELLEIGLAGPRPNRLLLAKLYAEQGKVSSSLRELETLTDSPLASAAEYKAFLEFWQEHCFDRDVPAFRERSRVAYEVLAEKDPAAWFRWKLREAALRSDEGKVDPEACVALANELLGDRQGVALGTLAQVLRAPIEEGLAAGTQRVANEPPEGVSPELVTTAACTAILLHDAAERDPANAAMIGALAESRPDSADVWQSAGDYYLVTGDNERACTAYDRAVEIDPERGALYNNLAIAWIEREDGAEMAERMLELAAEHGYKANALNDTRAWLRLCQGEAELALETIGSNPAPRVSLGADAHLHHSMALRGVGRHAEAGEAFERALGLGVEGLPLLPRERRYVEARKRDGVRDASQGVADLGETNRSVSGVVLKESL